MTSIFWFRRDMRLNDNEALNSAIKEAQQGDQSSVIPVVYHNPKSFELLEGIRQHSLVESYRALHNSMAGNLNVLNCESINDFANELCAIAKENNATKVFAMQAFDPEGIRQQQIVSRILESASLRLELVGSGYAVLPGKVSKPDGTNYRVYTPFYKAWSLLAVEKPMPLPKLQIDWIKLKRSSGLPAATKESPIKVIAGEDFALRTLSRFKNRALKDYDQLRNRADLSGTSHLSHALSYGEIHPRTILNGLGNSAGEEVFRKEIAWREFYADVLHHYPHTLTDYYEPKFKLLRYDTGKTAEQRFKAWCEGKTGYPMVDAGMRQLVSTGWMHNRVRMIVASFLVKDLHIEWTRGAAFFEAHLSDFDPASNAHGWQWTAGCGTDASPYYRIFNPILQGLKFDPEGNYVRKFVPELAHLEGDAVHQPWEIFDGYVNGYPERIVDHNDERNESLARLEELKEKTK